MKAKLCALANGMRRLLKKFTHVRATRVEYYEITHESSEPSGSIDDNKPTDTCKICFTETYVDQVFQIPICLHSFCLPCMSKHVEYKLRDGILPKCPHENCKTELQLDSYREFLSPELMNILSERVKEAVIPAEDRIYCPNPRCSTLFSKKKLQGQNGNSRDPKMYCPKCSRVFCIKCKVPWHDNMTCRKYKRKKPHTSREERLLRHLATEQEWRQCPKCRNMIERESGCCHIYCRCGHQFCYSCGADWGTKRSICRCPESE